MSGLSNLLQRTLAGIPEVAGAKRMSGGLRTFAKGGSNNRAFGPLSAKREMVSSSIMDPSRPSDEAVDMKGIFDIVANIPGAELAPLKAALAGKAGLAALGGVIKNKGGNWLHGSVEDALKGLKRGANPARAWDSNTSAQTIALTDSDRSINQWVEGPLTKYVKTRMATPDDEVRRLAEQGVLHFEPRGIRDTSPTMDNVVARRGATGNPLVDEGVTPLSEQWERYADAAIYPNTAFQERLHAGTVGKNPWLSKLDPDTQVYQIDRGRLGEPMAQENLGFPHLIDELSNAINPASGLPRNLQLSPEAMQNLSMEKAVRRVADINAWRAAQKVAANRALAEQASVLRAYDDGSIPNPKGLRWVELKKGELPDGYVAKASKIGQGTLYQDAHGNAVEDPVRKALADQLKYEGDTMGHCVGGYCHDVEEGRTRIFSLRDAKGEPHVTVEVAPQNLANKSELPPRIVQIKGKQNAKPKDEYLPFVQDFVRNPVHGGQWADVGDLQNTGLQKADWASDTLEALKSHGIAAPEYGTPEEINAAINALNKAKGFASGGSVQEPTTSKRWETSTPTPKDKTATGGVRGYSDLYELIDSLNG